MLKSELLIYRYRSADNLIQQELEGEVGDKFGVKIALGDICVTEYFIV